MAADYFAAELTRETSEPILRLYRWSKPALSLGYHQKISAEQLERFRQSNVPVVRRPTGGRAVLHDCELTYCLTFPESLLGIKQNRWDLLKNIGEIFVKAARKAGLPAELAREGNRSEESKRRTGENPLCFDSLSRWEVRLGGSKWIGSAQRFLPGVLLQHGSILLGKSQLDPAEIFGKGIKSADQFFTTEFINLICANSEIETALRRLIPETFSEEWGIEWRQEAFTPAEIENIKGISLDAKWLPQPRNFDFIVIPINLRT